ncbi:hypothetical protein HW932_13945 [Allochromatium humboldtianum]|uniref:Uncharacterized protein n=1 Tax=Allochromatium humboldtianum TaxID=504901 RepID=A0A850RN45_9GAMM|nr:hypothetical protein [Allochromatium humboldtianum]NVZ10363.1 hypothetical protein [Allochromatium humboldtianum]
MAKSDRDKKIDAMAGGYLSAGITQRFTERTFGIFNDADQLMQLAEKWKNVAADKAQGHMFEQLEVVKFNFDALKKDSDLFAKTTASMGMPHDKVDILIKNGEEIVREAQAKSCNSAARSAFALSDAEYKEMQRLAPSDQFEKIKELLRKRIDSGALKAEDYEQTLRNIEESLKHENVSSSGTTYQEALNATDVKTAQDIADKFKLKSALTDMHESGKRAGKVGALLTGSISAVTGVHSLHKGEIEVGELLSRVAVDSAKGYATGYVVTAMSKGITYSTTYLLGESVARSFARSNAPVAIAAGVVNASKSFVAYINGDIGGEQLLDEVSHTAITSTSSFYYGALGQVAIPIPIIGALVGAGVGYFIGNMLHQSGLVALGDSRVVKEAKERRYAVQAMCLAVIPEIQKNRLELESYLESYFSQRKNDFLASFCVLDNSLYSWNPDEFVLGLEKINNQFGISLQFKSFADFDLFMSSDEVFEF